ncbi:galactokinase [Formosa sp. PL04]|uniref:galactokinase n=1 Tax=Formosa sp. PL04 TaxID=3081755 RepID=UPI002982540D|nr:galactokinase [Formosa sp. PL04]MDW5288247.1 galactokinase [Formosa sp. PL04]
MTQQLIKTIAESFQTNFKTTPILVFSPGRINLIGEHTDYNEGFVFPAAIDKGIVAAVQKSETDTCTAFAFDMNESYTFSLNDIIPIPNGGWRNYVIGVVSEIQKKGITVAPFNIAFGGNIPEGAGLSSSAALENSVVFCLNELFTLGLTKSEMILISQQAEHNFAGVRCGIMDQYASMFGIKDHALLLDCRSQVARPIRIELNDYQLLLINTNVKHNLSEAAYNDRRLVCENICKLFNIPSLRYANAGDILKVRRRVKEEDYQKALYVVQENSRVLKAVEALKSNDLERLGELFFESHNGLRHQFYVSCRELDFLVDLAKENDNIIGARMMGGGFGGCTINIVKKSALADIQDRISKLYKEKFNTDCSFYNVNLSEGTHLVTL